MAKFRIPERVRGTPRPSRLARARARTHAQCTAHLGLSVSGRHSPHSGSFRDLLGCAARAPGQKGRSRSGPPALPAGFEGRTPSPHLATPRGRSAGDLLPHAHPHPPMHTRAGGAPLSGSRRTPALSPPAAPGPRGQEEPCRGPARRQATGRRPRTLWHQERTDFGRKHWGPGCLSQALESFVLGSDRLF